jgi:hypothetical protein
MASMPATATMPQLPPSSGGGYAGTTSNGGLLRALSASGTANATVTGPSQLHLRTFLLFKAAQVFYNCGLILFRAALRSVEDADWRGERHSSEVSVAGNGLQLAMKCWQQAEVMQRQAESVAASGEELDEEKQFGLTPLQSLLLHLRAAECGIAMHRLESVSKQHRSLPHPLLHQQSNESPSLETAAAHLRQLLVQLHSLLSAPKPDAAPPESNGSKIEEASKQLSDGNRSEEAEEPQVDPLYSRPSITFLEKLQDAARVKLAFCCLELGRAAEIEELLQWLGAISSAGESRIVKDLSLQYAAELALAAQHADSAAASALLERLRAQVFSAVPVRNQCCCRCVQLGQLAFAASVVDLKEARAFLEAAIRSQEKCGSKLHAETIPPLSVALHQLRLFLAMKEERDAVMWMLKAPAQKRA